MKFISKTDICGADTAFANYLKEKKIFIIETVISHLKAIRWGALKI
jgi:hypothetical protein